MLNDWVSGATRIMGPPETEHGGWTWDGQYWQHTTYGESRLARPTLDRTTVPYPAGNPAVSHNGWYWEDAPAVIAGPSPIPSDIGQEPVATASLPAIGGMSPALLLAAAAAAYLVVKGI